MTSEALSLLRCQCNVLCFPVYLQVANPAIVVPRHKASKEHIALTVSSIDIHNSFSTEARKAEFELLPSLSDAPVWLDTMMIAINDLGLSGSGDWQYFSQCKRVEVTLTKCLEQQYNRNPALDLAVKLPDLQLALDK